MSSSKSYLLINEADKITNQLRNLFKEKEVALLEIDLYDDVLDNDSTYFIKNYMEGEIYNSNIIIFSSTSANDGMAQLVYNSSFIGSTCLD